MNMIFEAIKQEDIDYNEAKRVTQAKISALKSECQYYIIGKSGQTTDERFREYNNNEYDDIEEIYSHDEESYTSQMETFLIDYFDADVKCKNERNSKANFQDDMTDKHNQYIVYVVYKKQIAK